MRPEVAAACEFLGLDPLNVANEGKLVAIVAPEFADALVAAMSAHPLGARRRDHRPSGRGRLIVSWRCAPLSAGDASSTGSSGEQLPRIC